MYRERWGIQVGEFGQSMCTYLKEDTPGDWPWEVSQITMGGCETTLVLVWWCSHKQRTNCDIVVCDAHTVHIC